MNKESRETAGQRIGKYIREHREARHLSARKLGQLAELDNSYIIKLEEGAFQAPGPDRLAKIAQALETPVADIYAVAGYTPAHDLPTLMPYLLAKYGELPGKVVTEMVETCIALGKEVGVDMRDASLVEPMSVDDIPEDDIDQLRAR